MLAARGSWISLAGRAVLKGVSLAIMPGSFTALIGPNGSGKSTLLQVLSGAYRPSRGAAELDGLSVSAYSRVELARRRAVLSQASPLNFPFTVEDVVLLGRSPHEGHARARANRGIAAAAMHETGIELLAQRRYTTLSGGERQRVQLARALAQVWPGEPAAPGSMDASRYLLLDEPTNNLDLTHQFSILATARRFADHGLGVLAVLHDPNHAARFADRICLLDQGCLVAEGSPDEVMTEARLEAVFGLRLRLLRDSAHDRAYFLPA